MTETKASAGAIKLALAIEADRYTFSSHDKHYPASYAAALIDAALVELREAARESKQHVAELRDAWQRGIIRESDFAIKGGTRSNRNADLDAKLARALAPWEPPK